LQKEPADRFATAGEMGEALREAMRAAGLRSGPREVSDFMAEVFAERAARRRSIVEQALASDGRQIVADELKQDTGESMPSGSHERAALEAPDAAEVPAEAIDQGPAEDDEEAADTQLGTRPGASPGPAAAGAEDPVDEVPDTAVGARPGLEALPAGGTLRMPAVVSRPVQAAREPVRSRFPVVAAILGGLILALVVVLALVLPGDPSAPSPIEPEPMVAPDAGLAAAAPDAGLAAAAPDAGLAEAAPDAGLAAAAPDAGLAAPDPDAGLMIRPPARVAVETMPPGCRVVLDGRRLAGTTPMEAIDLEPDLPHKFKVSCPGHAPEERSVTLISGEGELLEFAPRALPGAAAQPMGYLKVNSNPWSEVFLGRTKLGTTPLLRVRLPAGRYNLLLVNPNTKAKKSVPVVIRAGRTSTVVEQL
ncbi:MAG TPA: PEGA domain-containing protein, partial [Myxococcota bacterium]|nr:PEGA domain-containing protein [Myxococcota bacterium]